MIVMKFGGSSVANAERIRHVASIIKAYKDKKPVVVLSAMGDTTDYLLEAAENALKGNVDTRQIIDLHNRTQAELGIGGDSISSGELIVLQTELTQLLTGILMIRELTAKTRDYLVSFGERMSVRIMAAYLRKEGIPAKSYDAWDAGIRSNSDFMNAEPLEDVWRTIPEHLNAYKNGETAEIPIVTGFIAKDANNVITTLGRGGSDLSATLIGAAMGADEIQTWKDVDGIMTTDPRICPDAHRVEEVTYEEAQELAYFGAQVLHPRSMLPCIRTGIPVHVMNSYNLDSPGTYIVSKHSGAPNPVCAITMVKHSTLIDIVSSRMLGASGFLAHCFNQFLKWNISIDVIATSEVSVSLTVNTKADLSGLLHDLGQVAEVHAKTNKSIVTVICDAAHSSELLAKGFRALADNGINVQMISQGASKVNVSFVCDDDEAPAIVKILHGAYFGGSAA